MERENLLVIGVASPCCNTTPRVSASQAASIGAAPDNGLKAGCAEELMQLSLSPICDAMWLQSKMPAIPATCRRPTRGTFNS